MSELLLKFPGLKYNEIVVNNIEARFTATISGGATQFNFGSATSFASYQALRVDTQKYYYMDYLSVSATVNNEDFTDAVDVSFNPAGFSFQIQQEDQKSNILLQPFTFSSLRQNVPMNVYFGNSLGNAINAPNQWFLFLLKGSLKQTTAIVNLGVKDITVLIQTTIYEISNRQFISDYFGGK
jgi:hypothetical protein